MQSAHPVKGVAIVLVSVDPKPVKKAGSTYCFLLSFALGLRSLLPHLRHLVAAFGFVA